MTCIQVLRRDVEEVVPYSVERMFFSPLIEASLCDCRFGPEVLNILDFSYLCVGSALPMNEPMNEGGSD